MIGVTITGEVLPVQLIFEGKTKKVEPDSSAYAGKITTTHSDNHWATVDTTLEFLSTVASYRTLMLNRHGLPSYTPILLLWDVFYTHRDKAVKDFCLKNYILVVFVPANTTSFLQLCDVAVNKPWKTAISNKFGDLLLTIFCDKDVANDEATDDDSVFNLEKLNDLLSVDKLRQHSLTLTNAAIDHIKATDCIVKGAAHIGLDTIYTAPAHWNAVVSRLKADDALWKTFSRNDESVLGPLEQAAEVEAETDNIGLSVLSYYDAEDDEPPGAGHAADGPLDDPAPFQLNLGLAGQGLALTASAAPPALLAPPPPPPQPKAAAARRKCKSCGATTHRADNSTCPKYKEYRKAARQAAAAAAASNVNDDSDDDE